jgi:hypothetical protein
MELCIKQAPWAQTLLVRWFLWNLAYVNEGNSFISEKMYMKYFMALPGSRYEMEKFVVYTLLLILFG